MGIFEGKQPVFKGLRKKHKKYQALYKTAVCLFSCFLTCFALADSPGYWPENRRAAVVLSYDDALPSHLDVALPQLNKAHFKATFYITADRPTVSARMDEWRAVAKGGHELGNHTLVHPCRKSLAGREWVQPWQDLDTYSQARYLSELKITNTLLTAIDGLHERSFAYPCADITIKDRPVEPLIKPMFIAARFYGSGGLYHPSDVRANMFLIPAYDAEAKSGEELINAAKSALADQSLITFLFHGVEGDYLSVTAASHQALIDYLKRNEQKYWVTTMRDAANYMINKN